MAQPRGVPRAPDTLVCMRPTSAGPACCAALALLLAGCAKPPQTTSIAPFVDEYYDASFTWSPSAATGTGFHQYDTKVEERSAEAYARRIATLKSQAAKAATLEQQTLSQDDRIDLANSQQLHPGRIARPRDDGDLEA